MASIVTSVILNMRGRLSAHVRGYCRARRARRICAARRCGHGSWTGPAHWLIVSLYGDGHQSSELNPNGVQSAQQLLFWIGVLGLASQ